MMWPFFPGFDPELEKKLAYSTRYCPSCSRNLRLHLFWVVGTDGKVEELSEACADCVTFTRYRLGGELWEAPNRDARLAFIKRIDRQLVRIYAVMRREERVFNLNLAHMAKVAAFQGERCVFTGEALSPFPGPGQACISLIDPAQGYRQGNAVLATQQAHEAKGRLTWEAFHKFCTAVAGQPTFADLIPRS